MRTYDIAEITNGQDLVLARNDVPRAGNILSIQIGELEYAPDFGVDYRYFLQEDFRFQNDSFKAYLVQRLSQQQINVVNCIEQLETLLATYVFQIAQND